MEVVLPICQNTAVVMLLYVDGWATYMTDKTRVTQHQSSRAGRAPPIPDPSLTQPISLLKPPRTPSYSGKPQSVIKEIRVQAKIRLFRNYLKVIYLVRKTPLVSNGIEH